MNILFTICGRAGSKGFKNKNLKELNGTPLVYYSLAAIYAYTQAHPENSICVAVNTDSEPLKELLRRQALVDLRFVDRKEELSGDIVPKDAVIQDTYLTLKEFAPDVVVDLDITSPFRRVSDIENAIDEFFRKEYDIVFSVVPARRSPYFNMVEKRKPAITAKSAAPPIRPVSRRPLPMR